MKPRSEELRAYNRAWYAKQELRWKTNKQKLMKVRRIQILAVIRKIKTDVGCLFCSENEAICLDFHHKKDKEIQVADALRMGWSEARIMREIQKCVILCANCHRKVHAGLIQIPPS